MKVQLDKGIDSEGFDKEGLKFFELVTIGGSFMTLQLSFQEEYCMLQTKEGRGFALLSKKTFRSLIALTCFEQLNLTALVGYDEWKEWKASASKESKSRRICVDIHVTGPKCVSGAVANEMARGGLFLQPPRPGTTALAYENPQYLFLPGVAQVGEPSNFSSVHIPNDKAPVSGQKQEQILSDQYPDFDTIFDELPRHEYLEEAKTDFRLKTVLFR